MKSSLYVGDDSLITIVGIMPFVREGDYLKLTGTCEMHKSYGEQLKVTQCEKIIPESLSGLERYLADGFVKGIGPSTAKKIISKFRP